MTEHACCNNTNDTSLHILSKAATDEILGENLSILFAVSKKGEIVRYYPDHFDKSSINSLNDDENTTSLVIKTRIPKCCIEEEKNFLMKILAFFSACPCCQIGGKCTGCK